MTAPTLPAAPAGSPPPGRPGGPVSPPLRRPPRVSVVLWVCAAVVAVVAGVWSLLAGGGEPGRAALPSATVGVGLPGAGTPDGAPAALDGQWALVSGPDRFVGYRATERWGGGAFDRTAVGRTPQVTGTARFADGRLVALDVDADLAALRSDQSARDAWLRTGALETDRFPAASFRLATPVDLGDPAVGEVRELVLVGDLTLHGLTRRVEVPVQARWNGASIDVAGGARLILDAFGIEPPTTPFISVADTAELELVLRLSPAEQP